MVTLKSCAFAIPMKHSLTENSQYSQWSSTNKKGTCPALILATWHHTTESVGFVTTIYICCTSSKCVMHQDAQGGPMHHYTV